MNNDEPIDEDEESEDGLTPGDLLAFAWQISEGMVRILYCCLVCFKSDAVTTLCHRAKSFAS